MNNDELKKLLYRLQNFVYACDDVQSAMSDVEIERRYRPGSVELANAQDDCREAIVTATANLVSVGDYAQLTGFIMAEGGNQLAALQKALEAARETQGVA